MYGHTLSRHDALPIWLLSRDEYHNVENPASWKEGMLVYRNTPLTEIVADLQRAYHVRIKTSKGVGGCEISADFNNDSLTKVLRILAELVNGDLIEEDRSEEHTSELQSLMRISN